MTRGSKHEIYAKLGTIEACQRATHPRALCTFVRKAAALVELQRDLVAGSTTNYCVFECYAHRETQNCACRSNVDILSKGRSSKRLSVSGREQTYDLDAVDGRSLGGDANVAQRLTALSVSVQNVHRREFRRCEISLRRLAT